MTTPREVFFEPDEYARRVAAVQSAMAEEGLDLLVTPSPGNICYLNGYVSMNVLDIMFLCVPAEGDAVFYLWQFERGRAQSTVTGSETVCWDTGVEPIAFVADDLSRRGLRKGRIGMDIGSIHTSFEVVRSMLDALYAEPCRGIVETVRLVKSPPELDHVREAARITDAGARAALEAVEEGASDWEIAAAAQSALAGAGSEFYSLEPIICVGWRASAPHSPRGGTRVAGGDSVFVELSGVKGRYHAPLMRTTCAGNPSPGVRELADYSNAVCEALLETIRPGIPASDVAAAGGKVLAPIRERIAFHDLYAYPVGIAFPPNWIENPAFYLSAANPNPLKAGMVFHLPLTLRRLGEYGAGFSETVIITEDGNESLSTIPRSLDAGA